MSSDDSPRYFDHMGESSDDEDFGVDECRLMPESESVIDYDLGLSQAPFAAGLVRATHDGNDTEENAYHEEGECAVTVQKLIWADGWSSGGQGQRMTLVMLRLRFDPQAGTKVTYASLKLRLKSKLPSDGDAQLVAWAPFHTPQSSNEVTVHKEQNNLAGLGAELGAASQKGTAKWEKSTTRSWEEKDMEIGRSMPKFGAKRKNPGDPGKPNGVLWQVQQNQTLDRGIRPGFHVAALFVRPTSGDYKAAFRITVYTSKGRETLGRCLRLIRQPDGDKVRWLVSERPGSMHRCFGDGKQLIESVGLDNLNSLRAGPNSEHFNKEWREMLSADNFEQALWEAKARVEAKANAAATNELRAQPATKDNICTLPEQGHRDDARANGKAAAPLAVPPAPPTRTAEAPAETLAETLPPVEIPAGNSIKAADEPSASAEPLNMQENKAAMSPSSVLVPGASHPADVGRKTPPITPALSYDGPPRVVALEARMVYQDERMARLQERVAELERTLLRMTEALLQKPRQQL